MVGLIQKKYGESCRLRSPITKEQYAKAKKLLPDELVDILRISNGIDETMVNPHTGEIEVIDRIIYSFAEMKGQTNCYRSEYGGEGFVFAGDGAGGFFVLKPDGRIFLYEYHDLNEEPYAESLAAFFGSGEQSV